MKLVDNIFKHNTQRIFIDPQKIPKSNHALRFREPAKYLTHGDFQKSGLHSSWQNRIRVVNETRLGELRMVSVPEKEIQLWFQRNVGWKWSLSNPRFTMKHVSAAYVVWTMFESREITGMSVSSHLRL